MFMMAITTGFSTPCDKANEQNIRQAESTKVSPDSVQPRLPQRRRPRYVTVIVMSVRCKTSLLRFDSVA